MQALFKVLQKANDKLYEAAKNTKRVLALQSSQSSQKVAKSNRSDEDNDAPLGGAQSCYSDTGDGNIRGSSSI
jgi:hypothetical protein